MPSSPSFTINTLGCKVNQYESQLMRESLIRYGFIEAGNGQPADYCLVNSCTVTHKADRDTRNLINRFHRISPNGKIAVIGCYAELDSDRSALMSIPGVAYLVKNNEKERISDILAGDYSHKTPDMGRAAALLGGLPIAVSGRTLCGMN